VQYNPSEGSGQWPTGATAGSAVQNQFGNLSGNLGPASAVKGPHRPAYGLVEACTNEIARQRNPFDLPGFLA
jgi:hypothetical protein